MSWTPLVSKESRKDLHYYYTGVVIDPIYPIECLRWGLRTVIKFEKKDGLENTFHLLVTITPNRKR